MALTHYTLMIDDICKHGERGALFLQHFRYSLNTILHAGANRRNGLYWFKCPTSSLISQFSWLTEKQINTELKKLMASGVIIREIPKGSGHDRSHHIAMPNEFFYTVKSDQKPNPIDNIITCGQLQNQPEKPAESPVVPHLTKRENGFDQKGKCSKDLLKDHNNNIGVEKAPVVDNLPTQPKNKDASRYQKPPQKIAPSTTKNMSAPTKDHPFQSKAKKQGGNKSEFQHGDKKDPAILRHQEIMQHRAKPDQVEEYRKSALQMVGIKKD